MEDKATDVVSAEASHKRKKSKTKKRKKKKVKTTTLPPPLPPFDDHGVYEEELPQQLDASPVPATSHVSKRKRHVVVGEEDGREDPVVVGAKVRDSSDPVSGVPAEGSSVAAGSPVSKRNRPLEDDVYDRRVDPVDVGSLVPGSADPVSAVPTNGGDPVTPPGAAATVLGMSSAKKPGSKWGYADQLTLLKEMVAYTEGNGPCKLSKPYITGFQSSLPQGSSTFRFSENEILERMKDFKRMHANPNGMGKGNAKGKKPHVEEMVELAVKLWGEAGRGTAQKIRNASEEVVIRECVNDDHGTQRDRGRGDLLWEEAVVAYAGKVFAWPEVYTRGKIASMGKSAMDSMAQKWMKAKAEVHMATLHLI